MLISYPFIASWMIAMTFRIGARSLIASRTSFKSCALGGCFFDRFPSGSWWPVLCVRNRLLFISMSFLPHFRASSERTGPRKATARPFAPAGSPRGRREGGHQPQPGFKGQGARGAPRAPKRSNVWENDQKILLRFDRCSRLYGNRSNIATLCRYVRPISRFLHKAHRKHLLLTLR